MEDLSGMGVATDSVIDAGDSDFEAKVLRESMNRPVIVDFWAPWCEPCKALSPILERLVRGARGAVLLVKVDIDANKVIASQLGVQSIPMVYAFYRGQPVDGFSGNVGESQLHSFIDKLVRLSGGGGAMEDLEAKVRDADELRAEKDYTGALQIYAAVLQESTEHIGALAGLLHCYIAVGQSEQADTILSSLPEDIKGHSDIQAVLRLLSLRSSVADTDLSALAASAADKSNLQACYDYACARFASGEESAAMDDLLEICRMDMGWHDSAARVKLLEFFEALGHKDARVQEARRRLSSMLFS